MDKIINHYNLNEDIINNIKDFLVGTIEQNKKKYKEIMKSINEHDNILMFLQRIIIELKIIKELISIDILYKEFKKPRGNNHILIKIKWAEEFNGPTYIMINDYGYIHLETYEYNRLFENDEFVAELVNLLVYSNISNFIKDIKNINDLQ